MNEYVLVQNMDISEKNMETIQIIRNIELDTSFAMNSLDFLGLTEKQIWRWYFVHQGINEESVSSTTVEVVNLDLLRASELRTNRSRS